MVDGGWGGVGWGGGGGAGIATGPNYKGMEPCRMNDLDSLDDDPEHKHSDAVCSTVLWHLIIQCLAVGLLSSDFHGIFLLFVLSSMHHYCALATFCAQCAVYLHQVAPIIKGVQRLRSIAVYLFCILFIRAIIWSQTLSNLKVTHC